MILVHVHDRSSAPPPRRNVGDGWTVVASEIGRTEGLAAGMAEHFLFDIDVADRASVVAVRAFLLGQQRSKTRLFACRRGDRAAAAKAWALGATQIVDRPVADGALADVLGGIEVQGGADLASPLVGALALDLAFQSADTDGPVSSARFEAVAEDIASDVGRVGIQAWLQPILTHHAGTYRHCLLVTGLASAFGQELGLRTSDMSTLTLAALLHDVGKAKIPREILDKPSALSPAEVAIVKTHPTLGDEYLADRSDVTPAIRDVVRHHHEYLDGSGYPDGISGREIGDLTRLVTVADIFAALVEERSYKPALSADTAMSVLRDMVRNGKLEHPLVEAFVPVSRHFASLNPVAPAQGAAAA